MKEKYDFGGYATKNDLLCADGRTIRKDAFKDNDGQEVPLVWQHIHDDPINILGHCLLENREDGVYAYGKFNDTESGKQAKALVDNGDVKAISIYANKLRQRGGDVLHGAIREVSLVLAGANPGAYIDQISLEHSEGNESEYEAIIYGDSELELSHAEEPEEKKEEKPVADNNEKTIKDIWDGFTEEQKNVVYYMIGEAVDRAQNGDNDEGEDENMKHNVFEGDTPENTITHADMQTILQDGKKLGSLKEAYEYHCEQGVLAHAIDTTGMDVPSMTNAQYAENVGYGINGIDFLFPDAKMVGDRPGWIKRDTNWVSTVMNGTHHSPFSRIKSMFANITEDEARAKGYMKGNLKKEEFFSLLKRATTPQTIYKKQKLDRDDIIDITDFDVVAWIKGEMRMMLDEEIARAILVGDGRLTSDDDHISEDHIRPIWKDKPLFSIPVTVSRTGDIAKNFIRAAIKNRKYYKGSGNPTLFTTEDMLTDMLLLEDGINHPLYDTEAKLATALRVKNIVTVPVMENLTRDGKTLAGIIVNLSDYSVGADKGGAVAMFDDFDIDYNQQKYLIETRCSGALTVPYSAMVLEIEAESSNP